MTTKTDATTATAFDQLIVDIDVAQATMTKAMGDKGGELAEKVAAKKKGAKAEGDEGEGEGEGEGDGEGKPAFAKSLKVTLEDGTEVEAFDGAELVKSLTEQVGALTAKATANESLMVKAVGQLVTLSKSLADGYSKLSARVEAMSNEGRGRKAVLTLAERPKAAPATAEVALAKGGEGEGVDLNEFMAKATDQFQAGKITSTELCYIEAALNNRAHETIGAGLVKKVMAA